tara:strand:+ start:4993 stop:5289 length:297 start_codon:yes stop_codon:yes gene_type:complete
MGEKRKKKVTVDTPDNGTVTTRYNKYGQEKSYVYKDEYGKRIGKDKVSKSDLLKERLYESNPEYIDEDSIYTEKKDGGSIFDEGAKNDYIRRTTPRGY